MQIDEAAWRAFERSAPKNVVEKAVEIRDGFLSSNPEDRQAHPGKLKALKGKEAGLLQSDLPGYHRLLYRVDREERVVYVEYVGTHPNWKS